MSDEISERKAILSVYLTDETFGYETDLAPEEIVFWLDVIKASIVNRVLEVDDNE